MGSSMLNTAVEKKAQIVEKIISTLNQRLPPQTASVVESFAQRYYAHVAPEDFLYHDLEDLYGALLAHWNFARQRLPQHFLIRAYNPTFEEHGWQSTHTIIEIVNDDMPFLVDSIIMELNRHSSRVHLIIHPVVHVLRDQQGELQSISDKQADTVAESFMHCEIDRINDPQALQQLEHDLSKILNDIRIAVEDWPAMCESMAAVIDELDTLNSPSEKLDLAEIKAFLQWVSNRHFTFLGYRNYDLLTERDGLALRSVPNSGLGVLRENGVAQNSPSFMELPPELQKLSAQIHPFLILSKSRDRSTVHRPVHMDYIGVKRIDEAGNVIGEHRFLGLYTAAAYHLTPKEIPLLRTKTQAIIERSRLSLGSHAGRALQNILYTFPRDELLQATEDELFEIALGILHLQERQQLRLFVRKDIFSRFISCLVFVPRDRYGTDVRQRMQAILVTAFNGDSSTFATQFSESMLARVHFHIRTVAKDTPEFSVTELETKLRETLQSWQDELYRALLENRGEAQGNVLFQRYGSAFPAAYREDFSIRTAVSDIQRLESIGSESPLEMRLYRSLEDPNGLVHFKVFGPAQPMPLSDVLPILERMGLRVLTAHPYEIHRQDAQPLWLLNFDMKEDAGISVDVSEIKNSFQDAFAQIWHGQMENDGFNRLVLGANLNWRDVVMLRAYCKYLLQTRVPFSQDYMQQTLTSHPTIVTQLVELFHLRFDPALASANDEQTATITASIESSLEQVSSLDEDRILRRFLSIIQATLRTNFFQTNNNRYKDYLSFKLDPGKIPDLPLPLPMFEIFVYSPRVEAVHLRGGTVARGGLRWSDRREDFRTEVLGLMKAQMVKNSVIVPVGAKGGFVVKRPPPGGDREALQQEVQNCYKTFIRGMLDISDNRVGEQIVPPQQVVRYDDDDPYLVVAADKGTATFSDLANSVAIDYGFWMGDAFASGGSNGYDHKKMGITARGAWESVKRHFREMGLDIQNRDDFTVIGIGDMGGDVFGNGMLLSRHIKLLAAFNHLHIFLDPDPDPETSFQERERLFNLPRSSWLDYRAELISEGGGIYPRTAKSIPLSAQIRAVLAIQETQLTPNELINRILKAPVDLLWNGGIGTYVKAASETHGDTGDRANDAVRVNGKELRCKVVGEGGNLGFTQLGRIEYALNDGRILTDAIDNSAGVNCSDVEVNIKILLNQAVSAGDMTEKQRNQLLSDMTDEVAQLVLRQNYLQPEAISITSSQAPALLSSHAQTIRSLERSGKLNRALEFLPSDEQIAERETAGLGLCPPELAILLAYNKLTLFEEIVASDVPEDTYLQRELVAYFPQPLQEKFVQQMEQHPLRRDIIATSITNSMINRMGSGFLTRLQEDSGQTGPSIARAYSAARELYQSRQLWQQIDDLDNKISSSVQIEMHLESRRLLERSSLWLLRNRRPPLDIDTVVKQFFNGVQELSANLPGLLLEEEHSIFEQRQQYFIEAGVPAELAHTIVSLPILYSALDIVEVSNQVRLSVVDVSGVYFHLANRLVMNWLRENIVNLPAANHWQRRAKAALLDNLYDQGRTLTADVLSSAPEELSAEERLEHWLDQNNSAVERCVNMLTDFHASGQQPDLAMLSVAMREVSNMVQGGERIA